MSSVQGIGISSAWAAYASIERGAAAASADESPQASAAIIDELDLSGDAQEAPRIEADELSFTQRHLYSQTPDAQFYADYQTAYDEFAEPAAAASSSADTAPSSLEDVLGITQTELAGMRGVSSEDQAQYAAILARAYSSDGISDPRTFLQSLSADELDAVRQMHGLADTIDPSALSDEGATNLLLPEGYSVDFNRDGIDEVGIGKTLHFPPRDAPSEFTDAWFQATAEMGFGDYATRSMTFLLGFHPPTETGTTGVGLPSNQLDSYRTIVDNYLEMLETCRGYLAEGQYERDQPFFSRLQTLLKDA